MRSSSDCRRDFHVRNDVFSSVIEVIVERAPNSHVPSIDKQKFLVPSDITVAQFMWIVRKRIHLSPEKALFVFVGRLMPQSRQARGIFVEVPRRGGEREVMHHWLLHAKHGVNATEERLLTLRSH
ncbi:hypothetical protein HPB47_015479 [Ixodes persulcatus]|uniref:Uncharacterized protein n=1 Tax=Ixodes persulcatus TaxID=34615 RepID=A0AC60QVD2_IXOPE|nr:hypothetical protein HPB47_015479 [Ixodes persulcatus]